MDWYSKKNAQVGVYTNMYGHVCIRAYGHGTWGAVEVNTTFVDMQSIRDFIEAINKAADAATGIAKEADNAK